MPLADCWWHEIERAFPGGGGVVIAEHDDMKVIYEATVAYAAWLDFDVKPALTIDDAVPIILANLS